MTISELSKRLAGCVDSVVPNLLPNAVKDGREWKIGSTSGETGGSLGIERDGDRAGLWNDRASDQGGDIFELVKAVHGFSTKQAADWACDFLSIPRNGFVKPLFSPLTKGFKRQNESEWRTGVASWAYTDADGRVVGHVVRFNNPNDPTKKDFLPLRFTPQEGETPDPTNQSHWKWRGWKSPEQAPIYGLHLLPTDKPILIVEGEKTCDAARKLFPDHLVITWQGGSKRVSATDWSPIQNNTPLIIWPDHDQPGRQAATYLKSRFPNARVVSIPDSFPDSWDLADPIPLGYDSRGLLDAQPPKPTTTTSPYRCLGHDESGFHYLSTAFGRIITLLPTEHTELNLAMLAPDSHWMERGYFSATSNGIDYKAVAKALNAEQARTGFHDTDLIRGLGCWLEGDTVVYHAGDRLYVNGVETPLHAHGRERHAHSSIYIYPARKPISVDLAHPATRDDAALLVQLCELLPWHQSSWPWLLAAGCFISPICGALDWRPHLWLLGGKGTGKSFTYTNIMSPLMGSAVIKAQSSTTEAGIRQILQADALPVIFDEVEAKDERSIARIRGVLELARQSSSETGGSIFKGSSGGTARQFRIRSTFIFSSIGMGATESADESRIARMEFTLPSGPEAAARFTQLQALLPKTTHDPAFCSRIRARAILMAPRIRASAEVFLSAISRACGDSRKGQQYGTLAAGYWHLLNDSIATPAQADAWAAIIQWADLGAGDSTIDGDESRAIDILLQYRTTMQDSDGTRFDANVASLINIFLANEQRSPSAYDALMLIGVHPLRFCQGVPGGAIDIANRHSGLDRVFHGTPYSGRWKDQFSRIEGSSQQTYQPPGSKTLRSTRLPMSAVRAV